MLVLFLNKSQTLAVGRLGELVFQAGYYLYVGNAFGSGGLAGRLRHHLTSPKRHWHIDSLRAVAQLQGVWLREGSQIRECQWAAELAKLPHLIRPHRGFGSSDCGCPSHLFYCSDREALSTVCAAVFENDQVIPIALSEK